MRDPQLLSVLAGGNCSGCGACVLTGLATRMELDRAGDLRPIPAAEPSDGPPLSKYCPALVVRRPKPAAGAQRDPFFGDYLGIWAAYAADPELRQAGSSGGALSALARTALADDTVAGVAMASPAPLGSRTEASVVSDPGDVARFASSRYAPVSTVAALAAANTPGTAIVCRPCEASALRQLQPDGIPLVLAFFCAGVPSQHATDELISSMGGDPSTITELRFRGNGWPGSFSFHDAQDRQHATTYEDSWGGHLGPRVQSRCKICVDGVGESADVVAGDIWESDARGFPVFDEAPGVSVVLARTPRGLALVEQAVAAGHLIIADQDIAEVHTVQPAQVKRRQFLAARLAGRKLAGRAIPKYRGFGLAVLALRNPREGVRQMRGTYRRSR